MVKEPILEDTMEQMGEIYFKGEKGDSLSREAGDEFYEIISRWMELESPVDEIRRWGMHYYGREEDFVPINSAITLWEKLLDDEIRNKLWPFVKKDFKDYEDVLDQHGANSEIMADVRERLKINIKES